MKQNQFTWNWYHWELVNLSQWTILEPLYYSSFFFATLVYGVIGYKFCWLIPQSRSTSWTRISWDTNWARIMYQRSSAQDSSVQWRSKPIDYLETPPCCGEEHSRDVEICTCSHRSQFLGGRGWALLEDSLSSRMAQTVEEALGSLQFLPQVDIDLEKKL